MRRKYDFTGGAREGEQPSVALAVRLYIDGEKVTEERVVMLPEEFDATVKEIALRHVRRVAESSSRIFMVEFELLDEPKAERYLRFGTDPRCMVMPLAINPKTGWVQ